MFIELPSFLQPDDIVVLNNTQVIKARLLGTKETGGRIEVLVERIVDEQHALVMIRASHAPKIGSKLILADQVNAIVKAYQQGFYLLQVEHDLSVFQLLAQYGQLPLPPYIERDVTLADEDRYQTVFASEAGAIAAPTAGLHFDEKLLSQLRELGASIAYITLHVGSGTFQPVRTENILEHTMHTELYHIPEDTIEAIQQAKRKGGRVLAIGSTTLRTLESCAQRHNGEIVPGHGSTQLFVTPGFKFQIVDRLLTNFHLPRSTLIMMISAFAGLENIHRAYHHAIAQRYRFFSYGDAMLIERKI
jgi:S-adenosylmethionine:tRNA ribosyltransferase-isomerase